MEKARRTAVDKYESNLFMCLACKGSYTEEYCTPQEQYTFCPCCGVEIDHSLTPKQTEHLRRRELKDKAKQQDKIKPYKNLYTFAIGRIGEEEWYHSYKLCEPDIGIAAAYKAFKKECALDRPSYSKFGLYRDRELLYTYQKPEVKNGQST